MLKGIVEIVVFLWYNYINGCVKNFKITNICKIIVDINNTAFYAKNCSKF